MGSKYRSGSLKQGSGGAEAKQNVVAIFIIKSFTASATYIYVASYVCIYVASCMIGEIIAI